MTSNGPYYQSVPLDQNTAEDLKLSQGLLEYGALATAHPQPSIYPEPNHAQMNSDYQAQQLPDQESDSHAQLQGLVEAATSAAAQMAPYSHQHHSTDSHLDTTHQHLDSTHTHLDSTHQHLDSTHTHLDSTHQHLDSTHTHLDSTHQYLDSTHTHLDSTHPHLDTTEQDMVNLLQGDSNKRKRSLPPNNDSHLDSSVDRIATTQTKRQRRAKAASGHMPDQELDRSLRQYSNPAESPHHLDARAAGVHSAAALFRPPSDSSRKYTRPPMSKLFTSLELSPENFLYLQAAAKSYMLDPEHPERQACVGNRGKGDSEMVKLRLHQCVKEFLDHGGWGEKYFGENAPPPEEAGENYRRKYIWPNQKVIALCTPLLRRMVTNERQRQYAVESRKGGKTDKPNNPDQDQDPDAIQDAQSAESAQQQGFDPRLVQFPAYQVYLLHRENQQPVRDRIDYPHDDSLDWNSLIQEAQKSLNDHLRVEPAPDLSSTFFDVFTIRVLTGGGLTVVSTEGEWQLACQDARQTAWLDGVVKVIVECTC